MSRSYNSRRGHYGCHCQRPSWLELNHKGKQNEKRTTIKFDGTLYKRNTLKPRTWNGHYNKRTHFSWKWFGNPEKILKTKESYKNWTWLKGTRNPKGWMPIPNHWKNLRSEDGFFTHDILYEPCH